MADRADIVGRAGSHLSGLGDSADTEEPSADMEGWALQCGVRIGAGDEGEDGESDGCRWWC